MNKEKTEAMWLGSERNCNRKPLGISWAKKPLRVLGVYISYNIEENNKLNFDAKLQKVENILNMWKYRNLTMIGRAQIVRTFIMSQFLFVSSVIHVPKIYIDKVNCLIFRFIWNGKVNRVKRSVLKQCTGFWRS